MFEQVGTRGDWFFNIGTNEHFYFASQRLLLRINKSDIGFTSTIAVSHLSSGQETAVIIFLDDLGIDYKINDEADDTTYLLSSPANVRHLKKSITQARKGELTEVAIDDICTQ